VRGPRAGCVRVVVLLVACSFPPLALGACGDAGAAAGDAGGRPQPAPIVDLGDFDRGNFSRSTTIDNRWFPLPPGTQFVFTGRANRGRGRLAHRVVFTVTDLAKEIDGVRSLVLWDRDFNAGRLVEGELTFHAQDDDGNVWNLGEYPEEYSRGKLVGAPDTWISGVARARAGVLMQTNPRAGTPAYRQGWAPAIEFDDRAQVSRTGARVCIPLRCFDDVLVIGETNPAEPGARQLKYYAPGFGTIRVGAAGGEEREVLTLAAVKHLSPSALARVRAGALRLDRRAYRTRGDLYRRLPPARRIAAGA